MTSWADRMGCTQDRANAINQVLHRITGGADTTDLWIDCWRSAEAYAQGYGRTEPAVPRCARMLDIARHRARTGDHSPDPTLRHVAITAVPTGTAGGYLTRADGTSAGERVDPAGLEFATPTPLERGHDGHPVGQLLAVTEPQPSHRAEPLTLWARLDDPATIEAVAFGDLDVIGASYAMTSTRDTREPGYTIHTRTLVTEVSLTGSPSTLFTSVRFGEIPAGATTLDQWNRREPNARRHPADRAADTLDSVGIGAAAIQHRDTGHLIQLHAPSTTAGNELAELLPRGLPRGARVQFADDVVATIG